jgi:glutaconate CoA-transferase subunit A
MDEALEAVRPGARLALGGQWFHNNPAAAARALVRRGVGNLRLVAPPPAGYAVDLLLGAGVVAEALVGHVSFEHMGLAPNLRRVAEDGLVKIVDGDEATILGGLMAQLEHLPAHPVTSVKGTDIQHSAVAQNRIGGVVAPVALQPDVCILHVQEADIYGNVRHLGAAFCDPLFAKASRHVIVTADRIVDNQEVRKDPRRTTLPGYLVDAVVEVPYGAHPGSSHGLYPHDEEAIRHYVASACDYRDWRSKYLEPFVLDPLDHEAYLAMVGGRGRLAQLMETVA